MPFVRNIRFAVVFLILCSIASSSPAQLGISFDIEKPEQYEDRVLRSEKSDQKKFTLPRRFIQNTFTHYNYFFNANNKLNEVIELAKTRHQDDYTKLLPFYNYSLDATAADSIALDSVIYKATTGIVLHDLRNDWIDNMYLLMGASYYLQKQFDSAYLTFQFINYAFADKEKDGYYRTIGSNLDGNNAFSISTKEKNSLPRRVFSEPPSRNDAFIWQIRTLIAMGEYAEAASLIVTLRQDPLFPSRLDDDLDEVQAWWFYSNNMFDSSAAYLSRAIKNAPTKKEQARWEFLTAQLYEISGKQDIAKEYYEKVINHTTDPVMEIYARLHSIRINKEGGENYIDRNIQQLLKMAKRDKYVDYRDVIYYTVAQMELERNNFDAASRYLSKSAEFNIDNVSLRNKAYLEMAELSFARKNYIQAHSFYDSIKINDPLLTNIDQITTRKEVLGNVVKQLFIIERQDSLQRIARMEEEERKEFVRRIVRQVRRSQGLQDEVIPTSRPTTTSGGEIFTSNSQRGEWYFYNATLRSKGQAEFKSRWGNRPNVDNWRRSSRINLAGISRPITDPTGTNPALAESNEISFDVLYGRLPLTGEQMLRSNDSISNALFILGKAYAEQLDDCESSIKTFEQLRINFTDFNKMEEVLFSLYYCYNRSGEPGKATEIKNIMNSRFPSSPFTTIVNTGKDPRKQGSGEDATSRYENIYDLFIEGRFSEAIAEKEKADEIYGSHYWTPQLMYIEAVYYVKQRMDDRAIATLVSLNEQFPNTPLSQKASTLISVLGRREQIETELRHLQVESRPDPNSQVKTVTDSSSITTTNTPQPINKQQAINNQQPATSIQQPVTSNQQPVTTNQPPPTTPNFAFNAAEPHSVMLILNRVDQSWANETKNAFFRYNRETYYNKNFPIELVDIADGIRALLIRGFESAQSAIDYIQKSKPLSTVQIIPWLKAEKYSFSLITDHNLTILKASGDIAAYQQFVQKNLPGRF